MVVVALVVLVATYLTWLASRLDRLASRVEVARAGLVAQLERRAADAAVQPPNSPSRWKRPGSPMAPFAGPALGRRAWRKPKTA